jgi:heme/copper-type cytochrome/quinol oxidase subunit 2
LEPIEERFLIAVAGIIALFVFLIVFSRYKKDPKSSKNAPVSIGILVLIFMLSILSAQYSQFRTYNIISIVTMVVFSITLPLIFSLMLWKFRETRVFSPNSEITRTGKAYKLFLIFISYILLLGLINTGFSFLFNGIINPQVVALTRV